MADNIHIFGEFNIHMEKSTDSLQKAFGAIIDSVGFVQNVSGPTHCHSRTLDLVLSRRINVVDLNVFPQNPGLSDHHFITFAIATNNLLRAMPQIIKSCACPDSLRLPKDVRVQKSVHHLTEELNLTLRNILDAVAPLKTKNICHKKLAPWYTENTRALKQAWKDSTMQYEEPSLLLDHHPKCIFDTVAKLTKKQHSLSEDGFHFEKNMIIRKQITDSSLNHSSVVLSLHNSART